MAINANPHALLRIARFRRALDITTSTALLRLTARNFSGLDVERKGLYGMVVSVWHHERPPDASVIAGDADPVVLIASQHEERLAIVALADDERNVASFFASLDPERSVN
jgi:hypothetical protein